MNKCINQLNETVTEWMSVTCSARKGSRVASRKPWQAAPNTVPERASMTWKKFHSFSVKVKGRLVSQKLNTTDTEVDQNGTNLTFEFVVCLSLPSPSWPNLTKPTTNHQTFNAGYIRLGSDRLNIFVPKDWLYSVTVIILYRKSR